MELSKNEHPEFVGLQALKAKQAIQLASFEEWARDKYWQNFHSSHYDWWMFPYSQPSQFGFAYVVFASEIHDLKQDPEFSHNYLRGVELLLLSWGWDLYKQTLIHAPDPDQTWHNWPIRLYKCAMSLQKFGCDTEFNSVRSYARLLMEKGVSFEYNGRDLSTLFY